MPKNTLFAALLLAPALALAAQEGAGGAGSAAKRPRLAEQFKRADADGSGTLSRAEAEKAMPRLAQAFDAIDANRDGELAPDEIRAWFKAKRAERRSRGEGMRGRFDQHFAAADADGDGALSRAEAEKGMPRVAKKFERLDADHDGRVTREEIRAYLQAKRAARTGSGLALSHGVRS
ncbi:MAG: EF-hand domain-containing protein [Betaproteobacteria bacterium]|nr:EF-hand domain-containing protein [Betaproteobacteria bacterium]MBI2960561.1 EF-hand domain-containing protein [Betaproteobacteria bacterium]